ncbi:hypothetical protein Ahu01nite_047280 [Winogradskya humida]|uniref:Uncharacterized protein n=1 Tax=Winogradskya humida TaxID=113566 RepID=A0ABQ3ZSR6_9ACTN|nr:hypothetical protein Ahu01nite_047280 [Actinoplanes humidus]
MDLWTLWAAGLLLWVDILGASRERDWLVTCNVVTGIPCGAGHCGVPLPEGAAVPVLPGVDVIGLAGGVGESVTVDGTCTAQGAGMIPC